MNCLLVMNKFRSRSVIPSFLSKSEPTRRMCSLCVNTKISHLQLGVTSRYQSTCYNPLLPKDSSKKRNYKRRKSFTELLEVNENSIVEKKAMIRKYSAKDFSLLASPSGSINDSLINPEEISEILEELDDLKDEVQPSLIDGLQLDISSVPTSEKIKSNIRSLSKENRELSAKVKQSQLEKFSKEKSLNHSLACYLELCVHCGYLGRALTTLKYYISRQEVDISYVEVFNQILRGYARVGNMDKFMEVWKIMEERKVVPSLNSFSYKLECIANSTLSDKASLINTTIIHMKDRGYSCENMMADCTWYGGSREKVLNVIKAVNPRFNPRVPLPELNYTTDLLKKLKTISVNKMKSPAEGLTTVQSMKALFEDQMKMESSMYVNVESVEKTEDPSDTVLIYRNKLEQLQKHWEKSILLALDRELNSLNNLHKNVHSTSKRINIYPYLIVLDKKEIANIILNEIRKLTEGSETFSPSISQLYRDIGSQVKTRYEINLKRDNGVLKKIKDIYTKYLDWYVDPGSSLCHNSRQSWQLLVNQHQSGPSLELNSITWPHSILYSIGKFLYNIILKDIKVDVNVFRNNQPQHLLPGFYPVFRYQGHLAKEEIKPHPILSKLFRAAQLPYLTFSVAELPMLIPPVPWSNLNSGGYLIAKTNLIRLPYQAVQQWERLKDIPLSQMYPCFDSLNQLGSVPWKVNKKVLNVIVKLFNTGGCSKLDIPEPPSSFTISDVVLLNEKSKNEKYLAYRQRMMLRRRKAEMYSLWCDALYRLSLANHFKDKIFWLPHNMDFRGRVYPCPPHLNHLGSDMARSLLTFAKGQPLGPKGLDWLKIHLINLTGLKKRDSIADRLTYANEHIQDILDSAEDPLGGKRWWSESEEPWQTLACCFEIKAALECPEGPEAYVCHFPVHQDGSCNGLQHYAALGRDIAGAASVNLSPANVPQDVYSCVSAIVERERASDAEKGVKVAQVLEGFVKRKVIKQTVMTTVYGVTRFGARLQIAKQLKDIDDFPKEYVWQASSYLVVKTFASLREMFTSTKEIQDWFTESAKLISQVCGQNVEYVTPLGLPVVQPYFKYKTEKKPQRFNVCEEYVMDMFERPNVMKQKNAFPPNFIHSLDSTHMMLTSLHCEREGITFVSVHDCFWTHANTVHIMNKICREQFVALHSQPILSDLSNFLFKKYGYPEHSLIGDSEIVAANKRRLNSLLVQLPSTGNFDLKNVLNSVYFFS